MSQSLTDVLGRFNDPRDEGQLRQLDETVGAIRPQDCGEPEFRALLRVFERFPEDDGFGVFWSIVHRLEACSGYESLLIESVARAPVEFNVLMINRLLNGGVSQIGAQSLLSLLVKVASNSSIAIATRKSAQGYIEYQKAKGYADA